MGCSISPPVVIIRVHMLEKRSIYTDTYITKGSRKYYRRYVDDKSSLAENKEEAIKNCRRISAEDEDNRISWEVEFPDDNKYVLFIDTEIRIDDSRIVSSRYYRKPQNKGLTLNANSHQLASTKEAVMNNYYNTANLVSSGPLEKEYSLQIVVDNILEKNGYHKPRQMWKPRKERSRKVMSQMTTLSLPYTNEKDAYRIRNYIKSNKLPTRPIFTPGRTLAKTFCSSRTFDRKECGMSNQGRCEVCPIIENGGKCSTRGVVYQITCNHCSQKYQGETDRVLKDCIQEHIRAIRNPMSYPNNALGHHYITTHQGCQMNISVRILDVQRNTLKRKVSEALYIYNEKPSLNDKSELESLVKFV